MKKCLALVALIVISFSLLAQRQMESLDRGVVAVKTTDGVFLSWRLNADEWYGTTYNVYRNGTKLNAAPLQVSNYSDPNGTTSSSYTVSAIVKDVEQAQSKATTPLLQQYKEITLVERPSAYQINDATAADLDGDGEYEIIVKRLNSNCAVDETLFSYFEAYKQDGTFLWEINVGPNIMSSAGVEINIAAFDFDEDGKAEVFLRTSEGTIFADGAKIGDVDGDGKTNYRYSVLQSANMQYMNEGPEFLSLVDGETGIELDRVDFIARGSSEDWGDGYGHRANKFFFGAPYLDGKKPSLFIGRGIYTKTEMQTYDVVDKKLVARWRFTTLQNAKYYGQGNHNYTIADVDEDGRDEIVWGGMCVDDDGKGLYSTEMGHGDAIHVGDLDPFRKGTEVWRCLEESPGYGTILIDGKNGDVLIHEVLGRDCGRCCAANVSDDVMGAALWGSQSIFSATTKETISTGTGAVNFRIYWDGDLLEEVLDHYWHGSGGEGKIHKPNVGDILRASGTNSCNWTKGTPSLQADLFGDWREEVIWRTNDDKKIRIYTTIDPTPYRNYTLMHDHQYRQAICWQMCGYNQPPHVSYFLGEAEGMTVPPPPSTTNGRLVYQGSGDWTTASSVWKKDAVAVPYADGEHVHFDVLNGMDVSLSLEAEVAPSVVTINSPGNYTLNTTTGKMTGEMGLVKQGLGKLTLNGIHDFTGKTELWNGLVEFDGSLVNSPVWLNLFAQLSAQGYLGNSVKMRYGSSLFVGKDNHFGHLIIDDSLMVEENGILTFDVQSLPALRKDTLTVNGNLVLQDGALIAINAHLEDSEEVLAEGDYVLAIVNGNIEANFEEIGIKGILGTPAELKIQDQNIILSVKSMRQATSVLWSGVTSKVWDLANVYNFINGVDPDVFVTNDVVLFNDEATQTEVIISGAVSPESVTVDANTDYTFAGEGSIAGECTLTKSGTGTLTISNSNTLSGKVAINGGVVKVTTLPNLLNDESPLGPVNSDANQFVVSGGELNVTQETSMDRAMYIGANGAILNNGRKLLWNSAISGGKLTKKGNGELVFDETNTNSELIIQSGTVRLMDEDAQPGKMVRFEGGTLQCYSNGGTYSTASYPFYVGAGENGTINVDSRCSYTGSLLGSGTLNVNVPWIRTDFKGNWSNFSGTININEDAWFRNYNSYGYGKAIVNLPDGATMSAMNGQTIKFGSLTGTGKVSGASTVELGARNEDFTFEGNIESGNILKKGSGTLILASVITSTGNLTIQDGGIIAEDSIGKQNAGRLYISDGAWFASNAVVSKSLIVKSGGTLYAGLGPFRTLAGGTTTVSSVMMESNGIFSVKTDPRRESCDNVVAETSFNANGKLIMTIARTGDYAVGQSYQIVNSPSITGAFKSVSPAIPSEGLEWDFSEFNNNGTVNVVATTAINSGIVESFKLYPNPTKGQLTIELPELQNRVQLKLVSLGGRTLIDDEYEKVKTVDWDLSGLESGIYLIQISLDNKVVTKRINLSQDN